MTRWQDRLRPTPLAEDLERAHVSGVAAARAGMSDAALGAGRLTGPGVEVLADAAVSSATPYLRAPLLARLSAVKRLHPAVGDEHGRCPSCGVQAPCATSQGLAA
ncbi:MAG TPA: hypothetical protein VEQ66_14845 [Propionibacteriaceae bacterium]|nr:hypothetical protein [Propionibacteriaceae bacterium]